MTLDVWFPPDVRRILAMAAQAGVRHPDGAWRAGYLAALADVAAGFGLMDGVTFDKSEIVRYHLEHDEFAEDGRKGIDRRLFSW